MSDNWIGERQEQLTDYLNLKMQQRDEQLADGTARQHVAAQLDPDLEKAYNDGNPLIISAVKMGAVTNQQVAAQLVMMGMTSGLPPAIQDIVNQLNENQKSNHFNGELKDSRYNDLMEKYSWGALAGGMMMFGGEEAHAENKSADKGNDPSTYTPMTPAELSAMEQRYSSVASMSIQDWNNKSSAEQMDIIKSVQQDSLKTVYATSDQMRQLEEKIQSQVASGELTEEAARRIRSVSGEVSKGITFENQKNPDGTDVLDPNGNPIKVMKYNNEATEKYLADLPPKERDLATLYAAEFKNTVQVAVSHGNVELAGTIHANDASGAGVVTTNAAGALERSTQVMHTAAVADDKCMSPEALGLTSQAAKTADAALTQLPTAGATRTDNIDAGSDVYDKVAAAEKKELAAQGAAKKVGFSDDDEPTTQTASLASRTTVEIPKTALGPDSALKNLGAAPATNPSEPSVTTAVIQKPKPALAAGTSA